MAIGKDETFVAAAPAVGYQLLVFDDLGIIEQLPVLAFLVYAVPLHNNRSGHVHNVYPVTASGVWDADTQHYALLQPDGHVDVPEDQTFLSMEAFLVALKTRAENKRLGTKPDDAA
jgi:hypothetical protein